MIKNEEWFKAAAELERQSEVRHVLGALGDAGVKPFVYKGTALAYLDYSDPLERDRHDTDLLVRERDLAATKVTLSRLGYEELLSSDTGTLSFQCAFQKAARDGVQYHVFDVHWRISNRPMFRDVLTYESVAPSARPIPRLGANAKTFGVAHSLLIACLHPILHHHADFDLDWLQDIHRLLLKCSEKDRSAILEESQTKQIAGLVLRAIEITRERLLTDVPEAFLASLRNLASVNERSQEILATGGSQLRVGWYDFRSLPWHERWRFLYRHLFPRSEYIEARFYRSWMHGPRTFRLAQAYLWRWLIAFRRVMAIKGSR